MMKNKKKKQNKSKLQQKMDEPQKASLSSEHNENWLLFVFWRNLMKVRKFLEIRFKIYKLESI